MSNDSDGIYRMPLKVVEAPHIEIRRTAPPMVVTDADMRGDDVTSIVKALHEHYRGQEQESFVIVMLDGGGAVMGYREVARGPANRVEVPVRELFRTALACDARYLIMAHNHPSGIAQPSQPDRILTEMVMQAGMVINIPIVDHLIIAAGGERYYSFRTGEKTTDGTPASTERQPPELD